MYCNFRAVSIWFFQFKNQTCLWLTLILSFSWNVLIIMHHLFLLFCFNIALISTVLYVYFHWINAERKSFLDSDWCFLICQHVQLDHAVPVSLGFVGVHHCSNYHILHPYTLHSFNMGWVVDVVIISFLLCSLFCVDDKNLFPLL